MSAVAEKQLWRVVEGVANPPQDRAIKIIANIVDHDEWSSSVEPYEGYARWDERAQDWLNEAGLSIRGYYESELVILEWEDDRQFILKDARWQYPPRFMGPISPLRALKPLPLALPAPAWMSDPSAPQHRDLYKLSDAELEARMEAQDQFIDYILNGRGAKAHLWADHNAGGCAIERDLEVEAGRRWVRARRKARQDAKQRRAAKPRKAK